MFKGLSAVFLIMCLAVLTAAGCVNSGSDSDSEASSQVGITAEAATSLAKLDMTKWQYNADYKFYYQTGIPYCENPADEKYEQLAVFVPAAYMDASESGGKYTCKINDSAELNGYTPSTAPIMLPVNTPGYYAAEALTEEALEEYIEYADNIEYYTSQGCVYVYAGCRGIDEGAPAGVTDLKAAIRYIRYCDDVIAGDAESIFAYGMSGGGAQAAVLGASGDSGLYNPYLEAIGAVQGISDAVAGSMAWSPVTSLDTANAEYEWMLGCTRPMRSAEEQEISDKLAKAYVDYVNGAGFTDGDGNPLTLTESAEGIFRAGSYYDYMKGVIERSLNNYLEDTDFSDPELRNSYGNAKNYIDELNAEENWVTYDESTKTVKVNNIAGFAKACKNAVDMVVAFDQPQGENNLFGYGDGNGAHFDTILAGILTEMNSEFAADYNEDLKKTDSVGSTVEQRVNMYSPLYYLMESREGFGKSNVAKYWRIRTGIEQPNTSVTTEVNLALALESYDGVESVDFETVWAQGHTEAERTGNSRENFVAWVNTCMKG